jgi:mercuric ion binding protein
MRTLILITISLFISLNVLAQDKGVVTTTIAVKGNCEECKKRIENAADIKGVKFSNWDEHKQTLTVTYNSDKVKPDEIEKAVAATGHDAGSAKSSDLKYDKLPKCCQYRSHKCEEPKK